MAFKMEPGRGNYAKTGKGVPMVFKQNPPADPKSGMSSVEGADQVDGSFASAFQNAKGQDFSYRGKKYSGLTKEQAEKDLKEGNLNISNFQGNNRTMNASHYQTGEDTGNYMYYPLMGYDNDQISKNVQSAIDKQKKAAHALGRGKEATTFKNPF